jgi:NADH dehydrogenase (ubiquinone) 1 alpha subcomplex subunit 9
LNTRSTSLLNQSACISISNKNSNSDTDAAKSRNLAEYNRGTGGRSSFSDNVVTIFGATGMIGRILANRFGKEGSQLVCGYRGDPWDARSLKLVGDLGQVWFQVSIKIISSHYSFELLENFILIKLNRKLI